MDGDVEEVHVDVISVYDFINSHTIFPNKNIKLPLMIWMGMLKMVMLVLDMFI